MAIFRVTRSLAAGETVSVLELPGQNWKYNRLPYDALVEIMAEEVGGTNDIVERVMSGSDEIVQDSPIKGGAVAGNMPSRLNNEPVTWNAKAGDLIQAIYRNAAAAARVLHFQIEITPARPR